MPRVPVLEGPSVKARPVGTQYSNLNVRGAHGGAMVEGLEQLGQGIARHEQRAARERELAERARQRAGVVAVTDKETALLGFKNASFHGGEGGTDVIPGVWGMDANNPTKSVPGGFLSTRGQAAAEHSESVQKALQKKRAELAQEIADPEARAAYMQRTARMLVDWDRDIQVHVGRERERAQETSLQNRAAAAISTAVAAYDDGEEHARQRDALAGPIRALALSEEDAAAKLRALDAKMTEGRLEKYLAAGDWKGAEELLGATRELLGPGASRYEKPIAAIREDQEAERFASQVLELARDEKGRIDDRRLNAAVDMVPEGPLRDEARKRAEHRAMKADQEWKGQVTTTYSDAFTDYLKGERDLSAVDPLRKAWLVENAPEEWNRLEQLADRDREERRRLARRGRGSGKGSKASADQQLALVEFKADVASNPARYAGMTPQEWNAEWGHRFHSSDYEGAGGIFAATKKQKRESAAEFARFVTDRSKATPALAKKKEEAGAYRAWMGDQRRRYLEENGGKEPDAETLEKWHSMAVEDAVLKKRSLFGVDVLMPDVTGPRYREARTPAAEDAPLGRPPATRPETLDEPTATEARPPWQERAKQLKAAGMGRDDIKKTLAAEGY